MRHASGGLGITVPKKFNNGTWQQIKPEGRPGEKPDSALSALQAWPAGALARPIDEECGERAEHVVIGE